MHHSNTESRINAGWPFFHRRESSDRYKKHNKERILYINNKQEWLQVIPHICTANEVEFEDILSDHGQNEKEIFRFRRPLF
jgi:hypothetical protein